MINLLIDEIHSFIIVLKYSNSNLPVDRTIHCSFEVGNDCAMYSKDPLSPNTESWTVAKAANILSSSYSRSFDNTFNLGEFHCSLKKEYSIFWDLKTCFKDFNVLKNYPSYTQRV